MVGKHKLLNSAGYERVILGNSREMKWGMKQNKGVKAKRKGKKLLKG